LYPGIDLICTVDANRRGFEYSLHVEAGADVSKFKMKINKSFLSKRLFINTMAHEMVHQWEFEKGPYHRMTHGKRTFYSWKPECARWGINLT
jgi:hypothetical protein